MHTMNNVTPKDLAQVRDGHRFAGSTCTVLERHFNAPAAERKIQGDVWWLVQFPRPMPWNTRAANQDPTLGIMPDLYLRRLSGPRSLDTVTIGHEEHT